MNVFAFQQVTFDCDPDDDDADEDVLPVLAYDDILQSGMFHSGKI